jgi:hypothetical protein
MKNIILSAAIFGCIFAQPSFAIFEDQDMKGPPHFRTRTKAISIEEAIGIINARQVTTPLGTYKLGRDFDGQPIQVDELQDDKVIGNDIRLSELINNGLTPEVTIDYFTALEQVPLGRDPRQHHILVFKKD